MIYLNWHERIPVDTEGTPIPADQLPFVVTPDMADISLEIGIHKDKINAMISEHGFPDSIVVLDEQRESTRIYVKGMPK